MKKVKIASNKKGAPIKRLIAYFIDWYLSALCFSFAVVMITSIVQKELIIENQLANLPLMAAFIALVLGMLLTVLYFLLPTLLMKEKYAGQTIGKMIMKLRVVKDDDSPVNLKALIIRYFIGLILIEGTLNSASNALRTFISMLAGNVVSQTVLTLELAITFLSIVLMFVRPEGNMLHDILAKTKVIEAE